MSGKAEDGIDFHSNFPCAILAWLANEEHQAKETATRLGKFILLK